MPTPLSVHSQVGRYAEPDVFGATSAVVVQDDTGDLIKTGKTDGNKLVLLQAST